MIILPEPIKFRVIDNRNSFLYRNVPTILNCCEDPRVRFIQKEFLYYRKRSVYGVTDGNGFHLPSGIGC